MCIAGLKFWFLILPVLVKSLLLFWEIDVLFHKLLFASFFSRRPIHQAIGRSEKEDSEFYHSPSVLVYTFHLAFMTVFGFTSMHVQVSLNKFLQKFSNYCKMRSVCCREMNVGRWSGFLKNVFHVFVPKHKSACTTKQSLGTNLKLFGFFTQNAK